MYLGAFLGYMLGVLLLSFNLSLPEYCNKNGCTLMAVLHLDYGKYDRAVVGVKGRNCIARSKYKHEV